jgi:membrane fusion protein, multidrug efflux system
MRPVNVLRNDKPEKSVEQAVVASGLQPGEMVISEGQMRLMPGAKVELLKNPAAQVGASKRKNEGQSGAI